MPDFPPSDLSRRQLLQTIGAVGIGSVVFGRAVAAAVEEGGTVTAEMIAQAEWIAGLELSEEQRVEVAAAVNRTLQSARALRAVPIDADTIPALVFRPDFFYEQASSDGDEKDSSRPQFASGVHFSWSELPTPDQWSDSDLAFTGIAEQASMLASKKISSQELTELYLSRIQRYDPVLKCIITLLAETAMQSAKVSDERRAKGTSLGILDGIPWLAKDLIAVPPWKTTWGAEPFQDQVRPTPATVATKLAAAGTVLLAKSSMGALAYGDRWFGGTTRNPWNPEQGSSGSSAGSAAGVAAALSTFALGSETHGSIVAPCRRCRTSGLRPTFGRVSRAGCMSLAWSMDKIGPIARHVEDLAIVFAHLLGTDGRDPTVVERSFRWPQDQPMRSLKIGVTGDSLNSVEQQALEFLRREGAQLIDLDLKVDLPVSSLGFTLSVEATTMFDDAFRADPNADYGLWPPSFRSVPFTPAVQFLRANRFRSLLIVEIEKRLRSVDVVLGGEDLLLTNLTGHPSIVVACGTDTADGKEMPGVVKLTAAAYREEVLLNVGKALQRAMPSPKFGDGVAPPM